MLRLRLVSKDGVSRDTTLYSRIIINQLKIKFNGERKFAHERNFTSSSMASKAKDEEKSSLESCSQNQLKDQATSSISMNSTRSKYTRERLVELSKEKLRNRVNKAFDYQRSSNISAKRLRG